METSCLANLGVELLQLSHFKDDLIELGEELVNPDVESNFLDPEGKSGTNEDPSDRKVGFLTVGALLVVAPPSPAGLWRRQTWVTLSRPFTIPSSIISWSILFQAR